MTWLRETVIFIAGAEAFHTINHILLAYVVPIDFKFITLTPLLNGVAIAVNAIVTAALLWWAYKLRIADESKR